MINRIEEKERLVIKKKKLRHEVCHGWLLNRYSLIRMNYRSENSRRPVLYRDRR